MTNPNNAAQVAVQAAALPSTTQAEVPAARQTKTTKGDSMTATEQQAPMNTAFSPEQQDERRLIALAATWEMDALSSHLNATLPGLDECMHIRALVIRIRHLNAVVMSVLDGDARETQEIRSTVEDGFYA